MSWHTKGPWKIDSFGNIQTPTGILRVKGVALPCGIVSDRSEVMANTRLIAAAPDLLETLEKLSDAYSGYGMTDKQQEAWIIAEKIIAKAKGEKK